MSCHGQNKTIMLHDADHDQLAQARPAPKTNQPPPKAFCAGF